jgi:hypothetical protein
MAVSAPDVDPTAVVRFSGDPQALITVSFLELPLEVMLFWRWLTEAAGASGAAG